jgi:ribosomal protein L34
MRIGFIKRAVPLAGRRIKTQRRDLDREKLPEQLYYFAVGGAGTGETGVGESGW